MTVSIVKMAMRVPLWAVGLAMTGPGHTATTSTLDLTAGVGASSNPSLRIGGQSSVFGRISALGTHEWSSERTKTSISLFGENTTYLKNYGSKQIFSLNGRTSHAVSPNLSIFGSFGFQGDFAGQLSSRFASSIPNLDQPPVGELPPSVILNDPSFIGFSGRQYRLSGQAGVSIRSSARSSVSLSAGAQRIFGSGSLRSGNYNGYSGNGSWDYQFSVRTSAGIGASLQYQDYDNGASSSVLGPYVSGRHQFSDQVTGTASVGLLLAHQNQLGGGSTSSVSPSFSVTLCRANERERLCGRASRDYRNTFGLASVSRSGSLAVSTSVGVDYSRQIDRDQSVQASLSANHYSTKISGNDDNRSTYLSFVAGYDRKIRQRLAVGVNGGVRKLILTGADSKIDLNATAYVRYRLGDIQ